jgi:hypothetical protein
MERAADAYRLGGPDVRRLLIRAFLERIEVDTDDEAATLASPWLEIHHSASYLRQTTTRLPALAEPAVVRRTKRRSPDHVYEGQGSTMNPLVLRPSSCRC